MHATEAGCVVAASHVGAVEVTRVLWDPPRVRTSEYHTRPSRVCRRRRVRQHGASAIIATSTSGTVEAWLEWFTTHKQATCRTFLCTQYHLNALDAAALIDTALLQVFRHWTAIEDPLAYFWQTLKHTVGKQEQRRTRERRQLIAYAQQHRVHTDGAARIARHIMDLLERVSPRQCRLLEWRRQGYDDTQIVAWLQTTPQAVCVQRHRLMRTLRAQLCPLGSHHRSRSLGGK
jgi:hypothetical protein